MDSQAWMAERVAQLQQTNEILKQADRLNHSAAAVDAMNILSTTGAADARKIPSSSISAVSSGRNAGLTIDRSSAPETLFATRQRQPPSIPVDYDGSAPQDSAAYQFGGPNPAGQLAVAGIDTNDDGAADVYILGMDRQLDGITDVLQSQSKVARNRGMRARQLSPSFELASASGLAHPDFSALRRDLNEILTQLRTDVSKDSRTTLKEELRILSREFSSDFSSNYSRLLDAFNEAKKRTDGTNNSILDEIRTLKVAVASVAGILKNFKGGRDGQEFESSVQKVKNEMQKQFDDLGSSLERRFCQSLDAVQASVGKGAHDFNGLHKSVVDTLSQQLGKVNQKIDQNSVDGDRFSQELRTAIANQRVELQSQFERISRKMDKADGNEKMVKTSLDWEVVKPEMDDRFDRISRQAETLDRNIGALRACLEDYTSKWNHFEKNFGIFAKDTFMALKGNEACCRELMSSLETAQRNTVESSMHRQQEVISEFQQGFKNHADEMSVNFDKIHRHHHEGTSQLATLLRNIDGCVRAKPEDSMSAKGGKADLGTELLKAMSPVHRAMSQMKDNRDELSERVDQMQRKIDDEVITRIFKAISDQRDEFDRFRRSADESKSEAAGDQFFQAMRSLQEESNSRFDRVMRKIEDTKVDTRSLDKIYRRADDNTTDTALSLVLNEIRRYQTEQEQTLLQRISKLVREATSETDSALVKVDRLTSEVHDEIFSWRLPERLFKPVQEILGACKYLTRSLSMFGSANGV